MESQQVNDTLKYDLIQVLRRHGKLPSGNNSQLRIVRIQFSYNPSSIYIPDLLDSLTDHDLKVIDELCGLVSISPIQ